MLAYLTLINDGHWLVSKHTLYIYFIYKSISLLNVIETYNYKYIFRAHVPHSFSPSVQYIYDFWLPDYRLQTTIHNYA